MNVLITGGCGFIGFNLSMFLRKKGFSVVAMDNLVRKGVEISRDILEDNDIRFVHGDVRNIEDFSNVDKKIDIILNTAAEPSAIEGYKNPYFDFTNNFLSVVNVLELARKNRIKVIQWSTNKVYCGDKVNSIKRKELETRFEFDDENYNDGIDESFSVDGNDHSIYGLTKLSADLFCQEYARAFDLNIIINRFSCLAGEWQWGLPKQGWFSWWPIAFAYNFPISYIGWKGKQLRDILYVKDICELILKQIEGIDDFKGEVFNVGGGIKNTMSLMEATDYLENKFGFKPEIKFEERPRRADQCVFVNNIGKVSSTFNWEPKVNPESAMDNISGWVRENKELLDKVYK
ncbi:NAD-dependent epimerase/dehydratase family protein [Candidatus Woesearchaeota archaeon]|nr:NAD-dependent epimerase/dehydratase family protein [Candidatus Woesearchaeota archaeon]